MTGTSSQVQPQLIQPLVHPTLSPSNPQSVQPSVRPAIEAAVGVAAPAVPVVGATEGSVALAQTKWACLVVRAVPTGATAARTERGLRLSRVVGTKIAVADGRAVDGRGVARVAVEVVVVVNVAAAGLRAEFTGALVVASAGGRHRVRVVLAGLPCE